MMAQSNLEYGGVTLEELDKLDASRKIIPRPQNLPRNREEDDQLLDRIPLDTDTIAPKGKKSEWRELQDERPPSPFSGLPSKITSTSNMVHRIMASPLMSSPSVLRFETQRVDSGPHSSSSALRSIVKKRNADDEDEENPFDEIVTRAPPSHTTNKANRQERNRIREEMGLKPEFDDLQDGTLPEVNEHNDKPRIYRPPVLTTTSGRRERNRDEKITSRLQIPPTLIPRIQSRPRRLPNNPYESIDISKPTILELPIPPHIEII
ncbi:hypothetical protein DICVIV_09491 [Dictyocaulus viviparus]|uniref:Uncharacterized protein n=1 Tax=Dictyocaulus viviparus TaxID=29172 RepID=A0A0D8XIQ0_DICVI|nr:hypothetical protein DICVIV_09491 [Dictyocaulus viviparus]